MGAVYNAGLAARPPEIKMDAARALVNSLMETFTGSRRVQDIATSPEAIPSVMRTLANSKDPGIQNEIIQAAAEEGISPSELWVQSSTATIRSKIAPSLQLEDPNVVRALDVTYSGGKIQVRVNPEKYTALSGRVDNVGSYSGLSSAAQQDAGINRKLRGTEEFLNNTLRSYVKTTGASPDDVGEALRTAMELALRGQ